MEMAERLSEIITALREARMQKHLEPRKTAQIRQRGFPSNGKGGVLQATVSARDFENS